MLLRVQDLSVQYPGFVLHPLSFELQAGEILSVIGESGSGKTTLARAITCLLGESATVSGRVELEGTELLGMPERARKKLRMTRFSIALQSDAQLLNPTMTLRGHLREILDRSIPRQEQEMAMAALLEQTGLAREELDRYPRALSGGMIQKFLLACAVALKPKLVVLDEPTSSLDCVSTEEFTALIRRLNQTEGIAFLVITHDMRLAARLSRRTLVLYEGHVMEAGETKGLLEEPRHPYTRGLLQASISLNLAKDIWGIPMARQSSGRHCCPFYGRCTQAIAQCALSAPALEPDGNGGWWPATGAGS